MSGRPALISRSEIHIVLVDKEISDERRGYHTRRRSHPKGGRQSQNHAAIRREVGDRRHGPWLLHAAVVGLPRPEAPGPEPHPAGGAATARGLLVESAGQAVSEEGRPRRSAQPQR